MPVTKPIGITDRGILVCHQRRIKYTSGARFAAHVMRKIGNGVWSLNVERIELPLGLNFELPWALSHATCQLLYPVPGIAPAQQNSKSKDLTL